MRLFLEEAEKMHPLDQILAESGYHRSKQEISSPKFISAQRVTLPILTDAKA